MIARKKVIQYLETRCKAFTPFLPDKRLFIIYFIYITESSDILQAFFFCKLDKVSSTFYNPYASCGRGGIGIRARLRGVSSNGYGFKSRRPHFGPGLIRPGFFV